VSDLIELSIPVSGDWLVLARLTAAAVASRSGFDIEEIEDLRLAVDELCVSVVGEGRAGRLHLEFVLDPSVVEVLCTLKQNPGEDLRASGGPDGDGLSARILDALVDEHGRDSRGGHQRAWLRKKRTRQQA
jgi:serine/threonine-protein kinase RsbW